jgi:hypothetical protein
MNASEIRPSSRESLKEVVATIAQNICVGFGLFFRMKKGDRPKD